MSTKIIKVERMKYLQANIDLLSNLGCDEEIHGEYDVEVQNEDGTVNEDLTTTANRLIPVNRQRRALINIIMEG